jgi:hypothetical protein
VVHHVRGIVHRHLKNSSSPPTAKFAAAVVVSAKMCGRGVSTIVKDPDPDACPLQLAKQGQRQHLLVGTGCGDG